MKRSPFFCNRPRVSPCLNTNLGGVGEHAEREVHAQVEDAHLVAAGQVRRDVAGVDELEPSRLEVHATEEAGDEVVGVGAPGVLEDGCVGAGGLL